MTQEAIDLIHVLKKSVNPNTGEGWTYEEIGQLIGVSKQAVNQQIKTTKGLCCGCLRPLKKMRVKL